MRRFPAQPTQRQKPIVPVALLAAGPGILADRATPPGGRAGQAGRRDLRGGTEREPSAGWPEGLPEDPISSPRFSCRGCVSCADTVPIPGTGGSRRHRGDVRRTRGSLGSGRLDELAVVPGHDRLHGVRVGSAVRGQAPQLFDKTQGVRCGDGEHPRRPGAWVAKGVGSAAGSERDGAGRSVMQLPVQDELHLALDDVPRLVVAAVQVCRRPRYAWGLLRFEHDEAPTWRRLDLDPRPRAPAVELPPGARQHNTRTVIVHSVLPVQRERPTRIRPVSHAGNRFKVKVDHNRHRCTTTGCVRVANPNVLSCRVDARFTGVNDRRLARRPGRMSLWTRCGLAV
jgi:hypothetical protein